MLTTDKRLLASSIAALLMPLSFCASALADEEADTSGTNPAVLTRSAGISNEYKFLDNDHYYDVTAFKYTEPFVGGRASVRLNLPVAVTDLAGDDDTGIGDAGAKVSWVAHVDSSMGLIVSGEIGAPTASEDVFGSGKWTFSPGIVLATFVSQEVIIAPAYVHTFSFAGDNNRADINRGDFDLYAVYKPSGQRWWLTADLTASYDFNSKKTPMSFEVAYGRNLARLDNGAAVNGYIRPGIGLGDDRPYDFNIEAGVTVVGF